MTRKSPITTVLLAAATLLAALLPAAARADVPAADTSTPAAGLGYGHWNGPSPLHIDTTLVNGVYLMKDSTRPGLSCSVPQGGLFDTDNVWGDGDPTHPVTACVDAVFAAARFHDMLRDRLGRNGPFGDGRGVPIALTDQQNVFGWDGTRLVIGRKTTGEYLVHMDLIAAALAGIVDQSTPAGPSTSAGLGVGIGDVFAAATEQQANEPAPYDVPDYLVAEDMDLAGTGGSLRNMYNPSALGDPNCYSSVIPGTETHQAAGPFNHWFYLLAEGSSPGGGKPSSPTCNGTVVTGVGWQLAVRVLYAAMLQKTSGMTYQKYRLATVRAAMSLDTSCVLMGKVKAAWSAVAVGVQTGEPVCTPVG